MKQIINGQNGQICLQWNMITKKLKCNDMWMWKCSPYVGLGV